MRYPLMPMPRLTLPNGWDRPAPLVVSVVVPPWQEFPTDGATLACVNATTGAVHLLGKDVQIRRIWNPA